MQHDLTAARELAAQIRFSGDKRKDFELQALSLKLKDHFYTNELLICESVTPELHNSLVNVLERLHVPEELVSAFIFASPELNATCFLGYKNDCVLRFSSGLIDILSRDEFEFVVGHEIGHFLLNHTPANGSMGDDLENMILNRAQEISADRLGLIGCNSINVAIKALIKTVSGLTDNHLKFDVGAFVSQLQKTSDESSQHQETTHPSTFVRCRALLWFSLNESYVNQSAYSNKHNLSVDNKVKKDLDRYVDQASRREIERAKEDVAIWMAASDIIQKEKFTKADQEKFRNRFGKDILMSMLNFFDNAKKDEVTHEVYGRLQQARNELESLIPNCFEEEVSKLFWYER
jgi:hypothetical protein